MDTIRKTRPPGNTVEECIMSIDRRGFLKAAGAAAAVASSATAQARPNKTMPDEAVGLLFDGTLCIGCRACMPACKEANDMPAERTPLVAAGGTENVWDAPLDISAKTLNVIKAYRDGSGEHKDEVTDGGYPADIVGNAPAEEDNFFMVPKVVE